MLATFPLRPLKNEMFPGLLLCAAAVIGLVGAGCANEAGDPEAELAHDDTGALAHEQEPPSPARSAPVTANAPRAVVNDAGTPDSSVEPDASAATDASAPVRSVEPDAGTDSGVPDAGHPSSLMTPSSAVVTRVTANGSGCPAGTTGAATPTIAPDGKSFTVAFTQFSGSLDEDTRSETKNCDLGITVSAPDGQSYALQSLDLKGSATLGEGANVVVSTYYYVMGNSAVRAEQETTLSGPYDQAFELTHEYDDAGPVSPCGVERNINASLRFNLRNGTPPTASTFTLSSAGDAAFRLVPCP